LLPAVAVDVVDFVMIGVWMSWCDGSLFIDQIL
jgi:hypothetical protein